MSKDPKNKSERCGALNKELNHPVVKGTFNTNKQMESNDEEDRVAHSNKIELDKDGGLDKRRGGRESFYQRKVIGEACTIPCI
jgi:hypothetical protein